MSTAAVNMTTTISNDTAVIGGDTLMPPNSSTTTTTTMTKKSSLRDSGPVVPTLHPNTTMNQQDVLFVQKLADSHARHDLQEHLVIDNAFVTRAAVSIAAVAQLAPSRHTDVLTEALNDLKEWRYVSFLSLADNLDRAGAQQPYDRTAHALFEADAKQRGQGMRRRAKALNKLANKSARKIVRYASDLHGEQLKLVTAELCDTTEKLCRSIKQTALLLRAAAETDREWRETNQSSSAASVLKG